MGTITIWSDLTCPWAYVAGLRLRAARDQARAERVTFDFRAFPAELTDGKVHDEATVRNQVAVLAQLEQRAFSSYEGATWPASSLLGWEAQKWGYSLGQETGTDFDLALRRAFFLHSHDLSSRRELVGIATQEGLDATSLAAALDSGVHRSEVMADWAAAVQAGVVGSPQLDLPDAESQFNPGITHEVVRGIPIIHADHPSVYEEMIRIAAFDD